MIGAFLETTALATLIWASSSEFLPKTIDISFEYLRSGRPRDTFAQATITKHGRRVANVRVVAWQEDPSRPIAAAHGHFLIKPRDDERPRPVAPVAVRERSLAASSRSLSRSPIAARPLSRCSPPRPVLPEPGSYQLDDALEIQLFAAEPDVVDPVALAFDAAERMYVVEMRDYPQGLPPDGRPGGTIRLLEDDDRDGRADSSTVFAEGLSFPTSVAPWKGGVFVTAPPQILYLEDRDGDRRADLREVVYDGFTLGVTDSNVNGLRWAIDNRIHGANGGNGGRVGELSLRGLDFRFDPRTRAFETTYQTAGGFGLVFDQWGRSFAPYNIDHLQQRIVPVRYLARAPALPPLDATANVSVHGAMARIFPISAPSTRPNHPEQAGHYSAAGGIGWLDFEGEGLPRGLLVCDVVGNLVSREVLARGRAGLLDRARARGARARVLRQPRPRVPADRRRDGTRRRALPDRHAARHHRAPRLHPGVAAARRGPARRHRSRAHLPHRAAARSAAARGRCSRSSRPIGWSPSSRSPSRWRRDTAQRLLYERGARRSASLRSLRAMALDAARDPLARLHALWTLEGLGALDEDVILAALSDPDAGVRENALQIAERHLPGSIELRDRMVALADDPSARVRFQAALGMGGLEHPERRAALERILRRDARHRWSRVAVESALGRGRRRDADRPPGRRRTARRKAEIVIGELADLVGAGLDRDEGRRSRRPSSISRFARRRCRCARATLAGLASGLARAPRPPAGSAAMGELLDRAMERRPDRDRAVRLDGAPSAGARGRTSAGARRWPRRAARARDRSLPLEDRVGAVDLLALGAPDAVAGDLIALLAAGEPSEVEARAVRALAGFEDAALGRTLVDRFRGLGPVARGRCDRRSAAPAGVSRRSGRRARGGEARRLESSTSISSSGGACCGRTLPASRRARRS